MTAKPKRIPALQGGKSIKPGGIYWMRYVIPAMLFYVIFMAYPMLDSIRLSLYEGTAGAREFVGLDNYVRLFTDEVVSKRFWNAFGNNWIFFAYHMILQNALGILIAAILTNRTKKV
jgi:raffinose/stachyose/melibiose transport system permease protein